MPSYRPIPLMLVALLIASPALASFGGHHDDDDQPKPPASTDSSSPALTPRQQSEALYAKAYDEVNRAKKDLEEGKDKNAKKKFKDAFSLGAEITQADSTYHEAWNLMGYSARKLGWYDKALDAYDHCLRIKPDYAPAREYLGEAYVELKQIDKAREQLSKLEQLGATEDANTLRAAIEAFEKANPPAPSSGMN